MAKAMPLIFSTTEIGDSWQRCEQSAYWGSLNGLGLERPLPSAALALGSLVHYTMADWGALYAAGDNPTSFEAVWKGELAIPTFPSPGHVDPTRIFETHFANFKANTYERYEAWRGAPMDDEEWDPYENEVGEMGRALIANYQLVYGSPFPEDCILLSPELTIVRPLPKIHTHQRQLYIEGTLDQLLLDAEGMLFPRDFKTYNDAPSDYELEANDQFMTYCWLAQEEFTGHQVGGFAYDGFWKRTGITSRMRRKDGSPRDMTDLFKREYLMYSPEKLANHAEILPYRAEKIAGILRRRARFGPMALDKHRAWSTCPGCSFNDVCQQLLDGDFGEIWDEEAETQALVDYVKRSKTPAWRTPLTEVAAAA